MNYEPPIFTFSEALPVWMEGAEETLNTNLIFRTVIGGGKATLRITGQMHYVVRVNGELVCEGRQGARPDGAASTKFCLMAFSRLRKMFLR